jgi:AcrR family transcriptional regulator
MVAKRADAQRNHALLVKTARKMMRTSGQPPSFNALAERAGVGVGTVYRNFADPHALLAGLVEAQLAELAAMIAAASAEADPETSLAQLFHGAVELELASPAIAQLLATSKGASADVAARVRGLEASAEVVLARARKAGVVRGDLTASDFRRLVCGIEHAARSGEHVEASARRYVEITLRGVRPTEQAPKRRR